MSFAATYVVRSLTSALASAVFLATFAMVRWVAPRRAPRYLRWFLQRRGGGFAKLGQMLAMRFDLLPPAYYDELREILDRMPPVAARTIRRTIERDLRRPIGDAFAAFDDAPLASASIAQAHRAVLPGGERVVVKVMRPRIAAVLRADLVNLELMCWLLQAIGVFSNRDLGRIVREVKRYTLEELDFRREAFNAQALHDAMAADDVDHYSPRPYFALCGKQVLVLEELTGVWLTELIAAVQRDDRDRLARWSRRRLRDGCAGTSLTGFAAALATLPRAARELVDYLQFQVPRITTTYGQTISRLEHGAMLGLEYVRRGALTAALAVVVLHGVPIANG